MKAVLYCAGLGDVIRVIYQSAGYKYLCETGEPVKVILASHNPFTVEIFRHHRNARHFVIYDLTHKYEQFHDEGLRGADINRALLAFAEADHDRDLVRGNADGFVPQFDAPDDIASTGHIVFQPFAGSLAARTFSPELTARIVEVLRGLPWPVYLVTRSYIRKAKDGKVIHAEEDARKYAGGNITVLENLSVPASLNLIKSCRAYIGSWSSLHQAAWFENKPVAVLYPKDWHDVTKRTGYAFGLDRDNCFHCDFPSADMPGLAAWFARWQ